MPLEERTGFRSQVYSEWHRPNSIKRFLHGDKILADRLTMIDIDGLYVEAKHPYDRPPVALVETVETSRTLLPNSYYRKSTKILYQLSKAANIPGFLVLYQPDKNKKNPATRRNVKDIVEFYVKEIYPVQSKKWKVYNPEQYARFLVWLRQRHRDIKKNGAQYVLPFNERVLELDDDDLTRRWYTHNTEVYDYAQ